MRQECCTSTIVPKTSRPPLEWEFTASYSRLSIRQPKSSKPSLMSQSTWVIDDADPSRGELRRPTLIDSTRLLSSGYGHVRLGRVGSICENSDGLGSRRAGTRSAVSGHGIAHCNANCRPFDVSLWLPPRHLIKRP